MNASIDKAGSFQERTMAGNIEALAALLRELHPAMTSDGIDLAARLFARGVSVARDGFDKAESPTPAPHRCWELSIRIGSDSWEYLAHEIERLAAHIADHGPDCTSISGGDIGNHIVEIAHRPEMTHDEYFAQLWVYLAAGGRPVEPQPDIASAGQAGAASPAQAEPAPLSAEPR